MNLNKGYRTSNSFLKDAKYFFKGFSKEKYTLYDFKSNDYKLYLSDFQRRKTALINGPYSIVLKDKMLFYKAFDENNITPKIYGVIRKGDVYLGGTKISLDNFISFIKENRKIIIKIYWGGGGKNIYKVEYNNDNILLNDQKITKKDFQLFIKKIDNYLICEHLSQAEYSNKIYPNTINTIRVITMRDPDTNEIFIPIAVHKFGSEKTKPADNVWRGGLTALIDINTGIIQRPALHHEKNKRIEWVSKHPDTGVEIEGVKIPKWDTVIKSIISIANKFSFLHYVGWDIVVTSSGLRIIEGNNYSDVNILQIHQPLLINERVKKFYRYHRIIK